MQVTPSFVWSNFYYPQISHPLLLSFEYGVKNSAYMQYIWYFFLGRMWHTSYTCVQILDEPTTMYLLVIWALLFECVACYTSFYSTGTHHCQADRDCMGWGCLILPQMTSNWNEPRTFFSKVYFFIHLVVYSYLTNLNRIDHVVSKPWRTEYSFIFQM